MCSILGLPNVGSSTTVHVTRVNLNPQTVLVEFGGNLYHGEETKELCQQLKDIEVPKNQHQHAFSGKPGEVCLVYEERNWHRAKILSKAEHKYKVFLIDDGKLLWATSDVLAKCPRDLSTLAPKLELCILNSVSPLCLESAWSAAASKFIKSLCGKNISGCVQDVLMPSRIILLDIPSISKQMFELGFARKMSNENFKSLVMHSLHLPRYPSTQSDLETTNGQPDPDKLHQYLYPELSPGTIEIVTITQVVHPLKIYCKLRVFSQELKKLSDQLHEYYEDAFSAQIPVPLSDGSPCATKGSDGKWYRSVLQQDDISDVVKVFHVDYGIGDFVKLCNIRPLSAKFFHLPVVTYACSLHGVIDKGIGWRTDQIDYLKSLILDQVLVGKFENYCVNEGVYNVTLYGNDNVNVNHTFGHKEHCMSVMEKICGDQTLDTLNKVTYSKTRDRNESLHSKTEEYLQPTMEGHKLNAMVTPSLQNDEYVDLPPQIKVGAKLKVHITCVQSVNQFYGHFAENTNAVRKVTKDIQQLCRKLPQAKFSISPKMVCLAKFSDGLWHRGRIESTYPKILVQFVDYGDLVVVDKSDIIPLPQKASAIASLPIQAVRFELFNVTLSEPCEVNEWFKNYATDCMFTITVRHNSSGKLSVEMYDDKTNVNLKIKDMWNKTKRNEGSNNNGNLKIRNFKQSRNDFKSQGTLEQNFKSTTGQKRARPKCYPKLTELPSRTLDVGCSSDVYISHCNNPSDFFVQLTSDEDEIFSLLDKLNSTQISDAQVDLNLLQSGDLVRAEYPADGAWYRAVVQYKRDGTVQVQFIDFGNEATLPALKIKQLDKQFLSTPRFSIHCTLEDGRRDWTQEEIMAFKRAAGENGEKKIQCKFIREDSSSWLVRLEQPLTFKKPALTQGQTVEAYASSIAGPNHFWCQFKNTEVLDKISLLAQEIGNCSQTEAIQPDQLRQGGLCLALFSDQLWYRAQVINTHEKVTVLFIDYGNESETDLNGVKSLPTKLLESPPQAFLCRLHTCTWSDAAADKFFELLVDEPLKVTIQSMEMSSSIPTCPQFSVLVECKGVLVNDLLKDYLSDPKPAKNTTGKDVTSLEAVQKNRSSGDNANHSTTLTGEDRNVMVPELMKSTPCLPQARDLPQRGIEPGTVSEVYISHINNLTNFYVQLTEDEDTLFTLTELLNTKKEEMHAINVEQGSLVKALFPEDDSWYRAIVKNSPENDKVHVEFIDFGNEAMVPLLKIRRLDEPLLSYPRFSIHCSYSLDDRFKIQKGTEDLLFKKVFGEPGEKILSCNFIKEDDMTWEVKITPSGGTTDLLSEKWDALPIATQPSEEKLFKKPDVSLGQMVEAFASCIVGPDYFWCQFSNSEILDQVTVLAQECGDSTETQPIPLDHWDPRSPCLARFCDDQMWYRAQVIKKCANTATVLFIDFGNESEISEGSIKALPCDLLEIPPQAFLCCLEGFNPSGGSWESEATDNFYELLVDKPLKVTVQCVDASVEPNSPPYYVKAESLQCLVNELMTKFWKSAEVIESCRSTSVDQSVSENKTSVSLAGDDHTSEPRSPEQHGANLIELLVDDGVSENKVDDQLDGSNSDVADSDPTRSNSKEVCHEPDEVSVSAEEMQLQVEESREDVEDSNSQNDIPLTPSRSTDWVSHLEKQMLPMVCTEDSCDSVKCAFK